MVLVRTKIVVIAGAVAVTIITLFIIILVTQPPTKQETAISNPVYETNDTVYFSRLNISDHRTLTWGNPTLVDFNSDGYLDIVLSNHIDTPQFYKNNGDGTFTDIFDTTGVTQILQEGKGHEFSTWGYKDKHGFAWGDYNNDGILDLYIAMGACEGTCFEEKFDYLYEGDGEGEFRDITSTAGTTNAYGRARSASWIDYDNDGSLDLFVLNMWSDSVLYHNNRDGTFTDVAATAGLQKTTGEVSSWTDYNNDGFMDLLVTGTKVKARLFQNNGDGTFKDATAKSGLKSLKNARGVAWGDYDNDGFLDLLITRGFGEYKDMITAHSQNIVYRSAFDDAQVHTIEFESNGIVTLDLKMHQEDYAHDLKLHEEDDAYIRKHVFIGASMKNPSTMPFTLDDAEGVPATEGDFGYFIWKQDGVWHLRLSQQDNNASSSILYGKITTDGTFLNISSSMNLFELDTNILYRNNGGGTFTDVTKHANLQHMGNYYSAVWGDYDNDGWTDLYVVDSGDISGGKPSLLYHNNADGTFTNVATEVGLGDELDERHGTAAWGDLDNDGSLDLVIKNGIRDQIPLAEGSLSVYKNHGSDNHWLKINLIGEESNRLGIGTRITVNVGEQKFYRQLTGAGGGDYMSQGYAPLHFGLGENTHVDSIIVNWPSGIQQILTDVATDQLVTMHETT